MDPGYEDESEPKLEALKLLARRIDLHKNGKHNWPAFLWNFFMF